MKKFFSALILTALAAVASAGAKDKSFHCFYDDANLVIATVPIETNAAGRVEEVFVKEGSLFKAGDKIAVLKLDILKAQMAEAQADLAAAETLFQNSSSRIKLLEKQYQSAMELHEVYKKLHERKAISTREFTNTRTDMMQYESNLLQEKGECLNAQSSINRIKARIARLQSEMDNMLTTAAFDGRILQVINRGRVLKTGDKIADAADFSQIYMNVVIPDCAAKKLHPGREVTAILDILPQVTIPGKITSITPDGEFCCIRAELDAAALKPYTGMLHTGLKGEIWVKFTIK